MSTHNQDSCDHQAETQIRPPASPTEPPSDSGLDKTRIASPSLPHQEAVPTGAGDRVRYFGTYELLGEIARGGMGVVYKARQNTLNRTVAVKVILSGQLASREEVKRFLVEAEAAANLSHPGIVPVYEFGEHDGTHYFSMAYIDGPSLAEQLGDGPIDGAEAARLLLAIAEAVEYAHGQGVIHRDLKPGNILMEHGKIPRIADFGLAKRIKDDVELTQSGTILGSVYYMPPEQAAGRSGDIGPASDVYALGAILYKMLTGRPPFQAATGFETMQQVLTEEPVSPRQLNSSVPRDLETICLKCLEKEIGRRYESARALADELARFRDGIPILARPLGRIVRMWRWFRRYPVQASLSAGLTLALLVGLIAGTTLWNRAQSEHRRAQDQQRMVQVLSRLVLKKTLDETDEWLRLFFLPVEQELMVAKTWGDTGLLETQSPTALNALLGPIIEHYPQVSSLMVADGRGREHMLLCTGSPEDPDGRVWKNRITRRDEWEGTVQWLQWSDGVPEPVVSEAQLPDYDPRLRPWYQGAIKSASTSVVSAPTQIHWTDPYTFFTTKDLGITASVTYARPDTFDHVVAFDVLLQDITRFTSSKRPTENAKVIVMTEERGLIGLPHEPALASSDSWKAAFLKKPHELGLTMVARAADHFEFDSGAVNEILDFEDAGRRWWAGLRPFQLEDNKRLWVLVLVPESDLRADLAPPSGGSV